MQIGHSHYTMIVITYSCDDVLMSILQWVPLLRIITYVSLQNLQMFITMNFKIIIWICEFIF